MQHHPNHKCLKALAVCTSVRCYVVIAHLIIFTIVLILEKDSEMKVRAEILVRQIIFDFLDFVDLLKVF